VSGKRYLTPGSQSDPILSAFSFEDLIMELDLQYHIQPVEQRGLLCFHLLSIAIAWLIVQVSNQDVDTNHQHPSR
jgi:hypothetical protein